MTPTLHRSACSVRNGH